MLHHAQVVVLPVLSQLTNLSPDGTGTIDTERTCTYRLWIKCLIIESRRKALPIPATKPIPLPHRLLRSRTAGGPEIIKWRCLVYGLGSQNNNQQRKS